MKNSFAHERAQSLFVRPNISLIIKNITTIITITKYSWTQLRVAGTRWISFDTRWIRYRKRRHVLFSSQLNLRILRAIIDAIRKCFRRKLLTLDNNRTDLRFT